MSIVDSNWQSAGFQQITSLGTSTALTVPDNAKVAIIQCTAQNVRWRDDGTAPTAAIGMQLLTTASANLNQLVYRGHLQNLRFIEEVAGAVLNVSYYA